MNGPCSAATVARKKIKKNDLVPSMKVTSQGPFLPVQSIVLSPHSVEVLPPHTDSSSSSSGRM